MDKATYSVEHAKTARSKCKQCKVEIDKGELRMGKHYPSDFHEEGGTATEWRHPKCHFLHLQRARAAPKITSEAQVSGMLLLDEAEQALIRELIAQRDVKPPKAAKKAKASPKASPIAAIAAVAVPLVPKETFVCILEPVAGDESSIGLKRLELGAGLHQLGRGETTGIDNKGVSRCQIELTVKAEEQSIVLVRKGTNLAKFFRAGRDPVDLAADSFYLVADGDQFTLLGDQYRYAVKTLLKKPPPPPVAAVAPVAAAVPVAAVPAAAVVPAAVVPVAAPVKAAPKAKAAATTSLAPAKKKAKKSKKKKDDDDEDDDEPNEYDYDDGFLERDDDDAAEPVGPSAGDDDDEDDSAAAAGKKRAVSQISKGDGGDESDDDESDDDIDELAREARAFVKSGGVTTVQTPCRYGAKCFRTNAQHLADFSHPPREVDTAALALNAAKLLPQMTADASLDALAQVYTRVARDVIRDVLAANGNRVADSTAQLAELDAAAAAAE